MQFLETVLYPFLKSIQITDIIDVLIVAFVFYTVIKFIRQTRAVQLLKGIAILLVVMYVSDWLQLNVINFILVNTMQVGVTALLIIFQPELRRALEHMGRNKLGGILNFEEPRMLSDVIDEVCIAAGNCSKTKTGALMVFEKQTRLNDLITGGTIINADVSSEVLENIFVPNTPLHDGAVIIRGEKLYMASAVLPLSANKRLSKEFGTRHRAALGVTEAADCVALVVSEETGKISVMWDGNMMRNLSAATLSELLTKLLVEETEEKSISSKFFKGRAK